MRKSVCILTMALTCGTAALAMAADTKAPAAKDQGTSMAPAASATTATTTTTTTKTTKATKCKAAGGSVVSKDDTAKSFIVHPKTGADATFMTNDKTTYWHGKKAATWADLAAGDTVHLTCTMDGTNMVAKSVKMSTPKAAK